MYITYECKVCGTIFTLPKESVEWGQKNKRFMSCPYGHKKIVKLDPYEGAEKCMGANSYKRDKGYIKQKGWARS